MEYGTNTVTVAISDTLEPYAKIRNRMPAAARRQQAANRPKTTGTYPTSVDTRQRLLQRKAQPCMALGACLGVINSSLRVE
ncbi:hypothetical protein SERLADRAFT_456352 [Serpula lacrymans var. lacrymans S7.9]|uniref:Uncharacterized protein n=1 Tax=Serpula lacrymans var. lacrymans (strain S7.9) TaxID=578457 RepID=F8NIZ5_SERL9|nr:uncharacterized protein SERLADRAFT_456352 [Serpula lacrymans var. lacrymans S7.9]EGO29028.1 hypothetical protein SERLADRAFT_456352 [Serpula lacrymans var. lacrymans S7.9]